ncbi:MAG: glycosyltransferase, partial [Ginsengibacter sp.]
MNIAVDARCLVKDGQDESADFIFEIFSKITALHKEHTFIFIFEKPIPSFVFTGNVVPVIQTPTVNSSATYHIWYNIKLPLLLKKYKADVFVGTDGFCSLTTRVPQCLVLSDLSFLQFPLFTPKKRLAISKKFTRRFVKKATTIVTGSVYVKNEIINHYKSSPDKIQVIYPVVNEGPKPLSVDERESVKAKAADGNEYFVYAGLIHPSKNLMNLLKAFSAFKKRQKSSMRLVIVSALPAQYDELIASLQLFKFKSDVILLTEQPAIEVSRVIASAYAMIYVPFVENTPIALLTAMKAGTPIVTSSNEALREVCDDAALYAHPENFKEIAVK